MASGTLSLNRFRHALLNFYPLVGNFPHYMSLTLAKANHTHLPGMLIARDWLINNIMVEQRHLYWYRDWAKGFGISDHALDTVTPPPGDGRDQPLPVAYQPARNGCRRHCGHQSGH